MFCSEKTQAVLMHVPDFNECEVVPGIHASYDRESKEIIVQRDSMSNQKDKIDKVTFHALVQASRTYNLLNHMDSLSRHKEAEKAYKKATKSYENVTVDVDALDDFHDFVECPSWIRVSDNEESTSKSDGKGDSIELSVFYGMEQVKNDESRLAQLIYFDITSIMNCENPLQTIQMAAILLGLCKCDRIRITGADLSEKEQKAEGIKRFDLQDIDKILIKEILDGGDPIDEFIVACNTYNNPVCYVKRNQDKTNAAKIDEMDNVDGADGSVSSELLSLLLKVGSSIASALAVVLIERLKKYLNNQKSKSFDMKGSDLIDVVENSKGRKRKGDMSGNDNVDGAPYCSRKKQCFSDYIKNNCDEEN